MRITFILIVSALQFMQAYSQPVEDLKKKLLNSKDTTRVNVLYDIGREYRKLREFDSARHYFESCLNEAKSINYKKGIASGYYGIGDIYMFNDDPENAINQFIEGLKAAESMKDEKEMMVARGKNRMGAVYLSKQDFEHALSYLMDAEKNFKLINDTLSLLSSKKDLEHCYFRLGDTANAIVQFREGLALCNALEKSPSYNQSIATSLLNQRILLVGNILDLFSDSLLRKEAIVISEKIWEELKESSNMYAKTQCIRNLGALYEKNGEYEKAITFINLLKKDGMGPGLLDMDLYLTSARANYGLGNYKTAYEDIMKYKGIYDSIYTKQSFAAVKELETKYETEKKEQRITSLNKEKRNQQIIIAVSAGAFLIALGLLVFLIRANRLQKKLFAKEKELQKKEMEKRMFELEQTALRAQMNPHFIFNSLNSVQRFVINNDAEGVNQYLTTFANLIRQTLENSGKQLIPLSHEVKYLETYLKLEQMRSNDKFNYRININSDVDPEETYIPNMIIQPYLENSVIHGMAGKKQNEGVINLTISKNHKLTCVVEDNGTGISTSKMNKKQIDTGHESMGTAITEKRIEMFNTMNNEKIELEVLDKSGLNQQENGTKVMIKFPLTSSAN